MSKNKKPGVVTSSSEFIAKMSNGRSKFVQPPTSHAKQYTLEETKERRIIDHNANLLRQAKVGKRRENFDALNQKIEDLYNEMVNFYYQCEDVDSTLMQYENKLNQLDDEYNKIKAQFDGITPKQEIIYKLHKKNPKFAEYLSKESLESYLKQGRINLTPKNVENTYKLLGKKTILGISKAVPFFPQLIGYMDAAQAQITLSKHPELYNKCNDETKRVIRTQIDSNGKHVLLYQILKSNIDFINYISDEELQMIFKDYPSCFGSVCQTYPQILLRLKANSFNKTKPSVVFQSVVKRDLVANLLESENGIQLYNQIIAVHPELKDYFAKYVDTSAFAKTL